MKRFEGQVAVISGGADGLGKGIAKRIATEGGQIIILDINKAKLDEAVDELTSIGLKVKGLEVNVAVEKDVAEVFEKIVSEYGKIDVMVNSAGIVKSTNTKITDYSTEVFDEVYAVNLRGTFLMTKYALKVMESKNYGRVLLIASIAGKEGNPGMVGYSATKAGVIGLVKGVGKEFAQTGITINGIAPAVIETPFNTNTAPEQMEYMVSKIPMGRLGTVEEVAALSTYIVSKECSFSTGAIFDISGGRATY